jgi:hypothetical protein
MSAHRSLMARSRQSRMSAIRSLSEEKRTFANEARTIVIYDRRPPRELRAQPADITIALPCWIDDRSDRELGAVPPLPP